MSKSFYTSLFDSHHFMFQFHKSKQAFKRFKRGPKSITFYFKNTIFFKEIQTITSKYRNVLGRLFFSFFFSETIKLSDECWSG